MACPVLLTVVCPLPLQVALLGGGDAQARQAELRKQLLSIAGANKTQLAAVLRGVQLLQVVVTPPLSQLSSPLFSPL